MKKMRLDGFGLFVNDMGKMIRFYRDVLGFEIKEAEDTLNVYLIKDDTLFMLYERKNFEKMTNRGYEYVRASTDTVNWHSMSIPLRRSMSATAKSLQKELSRFWSPPQNHGDREPVTFLIRKAI